MGIGSAGLFVFLMPKWGDTKLAMYDVFSVLDRSSEVSGKHSGVGDGSVEFADVSFAYPHCPDKAVVRNVNFSVHAGQSLAIVGPSGSGKTLLLELLMKFYHASKGEVKIGGVSFAEFSAKFWRKQIGYVPQRPVLFDTTIRRNMMYSKADVTFEEFQTCAKLVNLQEIDDWRRSVPVDGEERKRLALVQALVRNPRYLLLDGIPSDCVKPDVIGGRTAIFVSDDDAAIMQADSIVVLCNGTVVHQGDHQSLKENSGVYRSLVDSASF